MTRKPTQTEPKRPCKPASVGQAFDRVRRLERERDAAVKQAADKVRSRYADRIAAAIDGCEDPEALNRLMQAMEDAEHPPHAPVPSWATAEPEPAQVQEVDRG